jgi:hypothetical protein
MAADMGLYSEEAFVAAAPMFHTWVSGVRTRESDNRRVSMRSGHPSIDPGGYLRDVRTNRRRKSLARRVDEL